jgi:NAD(P)-dependent dehydrogenase (short-subunit alcohol dehydrogenase family)
MKPDQLRAMASGIISMGRMQEVEDYLPGIIYLLSDASSMVTGSNLKVSGGLSL